MHPQSLLQISNLHVSVGEKEIIKGVDLKIHAGEVHAIMGPNGSGKSTLANTLAGHPAYTMTSGTISLNEVLLSELSPDERARQGLFLAFQYPVEVTGVRVQNFLKVAYDQRFADESKKKFPSVLAFRKHIETLADELSINKELLSRGLNEGFSGGEKKRVEILQMAVLEPRIAILDETDSGLDIDAIQAVAKGVRTIIERYHTGVLVITHYQRILRYLQPDVVHIMKAGKIIEHGGRDLVDRIEKKGYANNYPIAQ